MKKISYTINKETVIDFDIEKDQQKMNTCFLNLTRNLKFYRLSVHEKTTVNGELYRDEIIRTIHSTITKVDYGFNVHIESFDRKHRNRSLSISEKEFFSQAALITDNLHLKVYNGAIKEISNLSEIKNKVGQKINKLSKSYVGYHAENGYRFLQSLYSNEQLIIKDLHKYGQYGLLLNKFYGDYSNGGLKRYSATCLNLLGHASADIEETVTPVSLTENEFCLKVLGKGINLDTEAFINEMHSSNIVFDEQKDEPKLTKYDGEFRYSKHSGTILKSGITIGFSFGKNYNKTIEYTLKEISHEEL